MSPPSLKISQGHIIQARYNAQMLLLLRQRTAGEINYHTMVPLIRKKDVQVFRKVVDMERLKLTEKYSSG